MTTPEELRNDLEKILLIIHEKHRLNLHAIYRETNSELVGRDEIKPKYPEKLVEWG